MSGRSADFARVVGFERWHANSVKRVLEA
jgi:hypothetical protein